MLSRAATRRQFLAGTAGTGLGAMAHGLPFLSPAPRDEKLNIACIGCGGKGGSDVQGVSSENIVALCDVDFSRASGTFAKFPKARRYRDYRYMLQDMGERIDAVTVSTPDHTHFPAAMMAMSMGKHVFVQKPIAHSVWEARQLRLAATRYGVATQMGNQGHANTGTRLIYEWVRSGAIGPVHEVHLWTNRPIWPQGEAPPADGETPPPDLDWNLFLGTAPYRPYHTAYHPFKWRGWWDFGCGALGDMGCHIMDASFWALGLGAPEWVEAESDAPDADTTPTWSVVTYRFPARGKMPPVTVTWYDGNRKPERPADLEADRELQANGQLIVGEDATIMADTYASSPRIIPETRMRAIGKPPQLVERVDGGHYHEWLRACKGGTPAGSNFVDHAGPLTEMVLLGNLAIRTGKRIVWDDRRLHCANVPAANDLVRHPYRIY